MNSPIWSRTVLIAGLVLSLASSVAPLQAQDGSAAVEPAIPEWTEDLRTLQIDEGLLSEGIAYYLIKDEDAQVRIDLDSGLTRMVATSSKAGGFIVGPFDADEVEGEQSPLIAGAIRIPAASLLAGTSFDRMIQSSMVFDADNHQDISFVFESAKTLGRRAGDISDSTVFDLELKGSAVFKGKAVPLEISAELVLFLSNNTTMMKTVGDVARLEGSFELTAEQLGLIPRVASMFGSTAQVNFFLMFSTVDPQRSIIPPSTPAAYTLEGRYLSSLRDRNDPEAAFRAGEDLIKAAWDDAAALRSFAASAVSDAGSGRRFLGQAKRAAERAVKLGGDKPDPLALNVLAKIAAETGEVARAIELQKKAIALAESGPAARAKATMEADLALYEAMKAARSEAR